MTERSELDAALRASAAASSPEPDAAFLDALELRLTSITPSGVVVPFARRVRRVSAGVVVAATLTFAGAAAAAGIAVARPFHDDPPATTAVPPTSALASATGAIETTTVVAVASTTLPSTVAPATSPPITVAATVVPATAPATAPPTTAPPTTGAPPSTTVSPSTTEVHTAATITLRCAVDAGTVFCDWSPGPSGTVRYAVLRSQQGTGPGRVYFVELGVTTWTDPLAVPGTVATYLVHAFDAQDRSLAHSVGVAVPCC